MRPDAAQAITTSELPGGTGPLAQYAGTGVPVTASMSGSAGDRRCKQGGTVECNSYIPPLSHIRGGIFYFAPRIT